MKPTGTKPTAAPKPNPGTYWIKVTTSKYVYVNTPNQSSQSYYSWVNCHQTWLIATWDEDGDYYQIIGSDEIFDWCKFDRCGRYCVVTEVGPKLNPPE